MNNQVPEWDGVFVDGCDPFMFDILEAPELRVVSKIVAANHSTRTGFRFGVEIASGQKAAVELERSIVLLEPVLRTIFNFS